MALNYSNSSNVEQLALKVLRCPTSKGSSGKICLLLIILLAMPMPFVTLNWLHATTNDATNKR